MTEQQRIFLAVVLCMGIVLAFQFIQPALAPPAPEQRPQKAAAEPAPQRPTAEAPRIESGIASENAAGAAAPAKEPTPPEWVARSVAFDTPLFTGTITSGDGSLTALALKQYNERPEEDAQPLPVSLVTAPGGPLVRQASIGWALGGIAAPLLDFASEEGELVLSGRTVEGVGLRISILPQADRYALAYRLEVENGTERTLPVGATATLALLEREESGGFLTPPSDRVQALCATAGDLERLTGADLRDDGPWKGPGDAKWVALDRQYFVVALSPTQERGQRSCHLSAGKSTVAVDYAFGAEDVAPGGKWQQSFLLYAGPKREERLTEVAAYLNQVIEYNIMGIPLGFLARPMIYLMDTFHGWTGSWGIAIILLTLFVKTLLFPITLKTSLSMRKMQLLRPELDKLKERFPNDRERQQMEQLKLFREKGVNPLGGCLPMLLQMPVWFALYRALWTAVDLYQQGFLWISDLTAKESFPFLAIACGGLMFVQQKLTPMATDNQQAKVMMYTMPVIFPIIMMGLPSGLVLYIAINSVLTIFQQMAINRRKVTL